jgi:hypothetical protein
MDTLIILKETQKIVTVRSVISFTEQNFNSFNSNIDWVELNKAFGVDELNCLIQPLLIHQHHKGNIVFPHLRCLVQIENIPILLLQDLSFEQWSRISND